MEIYLLKRLTPFMFDACMVNAYNAVLSYSLLCNIKDKVSCSIFYDSNWPSCFINLFYALHFT